MVALRPHLLGAFAFALLLIVPIATWLMSGSSDPPGTTSETGPVPRGAPPPPLVAAYARPLFATTLELEGTAPDDAPVLVGIAGRLGRDAIAMVRAPDGTRTMRIGEAVDGWRLDSLAVDAAYFTRGGQRARVALAPE